MNRNWILFFCLLGIGCIPANAFTEVESNKVDDYDFKSKKLFILAYDSEGSEKIMREISSQISEILSTYSIENILHNETIRDLDFEPNYPQEKINDYKPDTILILAFDKGSFLNNDLTNFDMKSTLVDPIEGRIIWKAGLNSRKGMGEGGIDTPKLVEDMAMKFIQKMWDDDLLDITDRPATFTTYTY